MKFATEDMNDIAWIRNPDGYGAGETIRRIMDAGKWEEFLAIHQDEETGVVDCDGLYDYLRYESGEALQDVGLHDNEATATVSEVVEAWEKENAPAKVKREDGNLCVTITCGDLDLEVCDDDYVDGEYTESLSADDIVELMRDKHHGNANTGEWDCEDVEAAEFEMWRSRR